MIHESKNKKSLIRKYIISLIVMAMLAIAACFYWWAYTQRFNQDSVNTATQGIFFTKTLHLNEYRNVSSGLDIWGNYERYSRSDRHSEALTVYCHEFCTKK